MHKILTADYSHHILTLTSQSLTSIDVLSYVISFNAHRRSDRANLIYTALTAFQRTTGKVKFLMDRPRLHKPNYHPNMFATRRLKESSIAVRYLNTGDTQHAKLFLFDQKLAVLGSHNLTPSSLRNRYDISILLDDPTSLSYLNAYFNSIWQSSIEA